MFVQKRSFSNLINYNNLKKYDPILYTLIRNEQKRQKQTMNFIASENFTQPAVLEALGSCLTNIYSEGYPGARYYAGNEYIDSIERICQERALKLFGLNKNQWGVNVQSYSGSIANISIFSSVLEPHEKVMGLALDSGGHLSHGYYRNNKAVNCSSKFFSSLPYEVDTVKGKIDFELFEKNALLFKPKLIVTGGSAYPRDWEYQKFKNVSDKLGAILMADISHYSGLVASKLLNNPFEHCDIVMSTTHKTLGGPRGALIFYKKKYEQKINFSVFPYVQGGPHNNNIGAIAVTMGMILNNKSKFVEHCERIVENARILASELIKRDNTVVTGGTDTHLLLWDLKKNGLSGHLFESFCEKVGIVLNKNTIPGDKSPLKPSGVRLGTSALTTRGLDKKDIIQTVDFLLEARDIAKEMSDIKGENDLMVELKNSGFKGNPKIK